MNDNHKETDMTKIAEKFAKLLNDDGMNFETDDGESFEDLADRLGADVQFARRLLDVTTEEEVTVPCALTERFAGDPVRYVFADGSAIVACGDAWDVEGETPFSWAGA